MSAYIFLRPICDLKELYTVNGEDADEVFHNIEFSLFTGKRNIMERFEDYISLLREKLNFSHREMLDNS